MSPAQIVRYARNCNKLRQSDHRHDLTMAWMNAALQRAKKMPTLETLLRPTRTKPTLDEIVGKLKSLK